MVINQTYQYNLSCIKKKSLPLDHPVVEGNIYGRVVQGNIWEPIET